jgi:hypothetical protein
VVEGGLVGGGGEAGGAVESTMGLAALKATPWCSAGRKPEVQLAGPEAGCRGRQGTGDVGGEVIAFGAEGVAEPGARAEGKPSKTNARCSWRRRRGRGCWSVNWRGVDERHAVDVAGEMGRVWW